MRHALASYISATLLSLAALGSTALLASHIRDQLTKTPSPLILLEANIVPAKPLPHLYLAVKLSRPEALTAVIFDGEVAGNGRFLVFGGVRPKPYDSSSQGYLAFSVRTLAGPLSIGGAEAYVDGFPAGTVMVSEGWHSIWVRIPSNFAVVLPGGPIIQPENLAAQASPFPIVGRENPALQYILLLPHPGSVAVSVRVGDSIARAILPP